MQFSSKMLGLLLGITLLICAACTAPPENSSETEQQVKAPLLVKEIDQIAEKVTVRIESASSGSGVIVSKEKGFFNSTYYVLTTKHVIEFNEFSIVTPDGKEYQLHRSDVTEVPNADLALVKFASSQDYATATLSSYDFENRNAWLNKSKSVASAFVSGFPDFKQEKTFKANQRLLTFGSLQNKLDSLFLVTQEGFVKDSDEYARTYEYAYSNITYRGMSGSPILSSSGQVIGIHGRNTGETTEQGRRMILGVSLGVPITNFLESHTAKQIRLKINNSAPIPLAGKVSEDTLLPLRRAKCEDLIDCLNYSNELMRVGDHQNASVLIQKVVEQKPDFYPAWYLQGKIFMDLEQPESEKALASFERAIMLKPDYYPAWNSRCYVLQQWLKRSEDAFECLDTLSKKQPRGFGVWHSRGEVLTELKRYKEAVASYDRAIKIRPNSHTYNNRGIIRLQELEDTQGAIDDFTKSIKLNPNYSLAYNNRGFAFSYLKNCIKALPDFNEALRIESSYPSYLGNNLVVSMKTHRGKCLADLGNKKAAIQDLESAIEIGMKDHIETIRTRKDLAINKKLGNKDGVIQDLELTLESKAINKQDREVIKSAVFTQLAISFLIDIDPSNSNAYFARALRNQLAKQYTEAVLDYSKAIQVNPKNADAFLNRGIVRFENLNDNQGAIDDFNQVINIEPTKPSTAIAYLYRGQARFLPIELFPSESSVGQESTYYYRGNNEDKLLQDFQAAIQLLRKAKGRNIVPAARSVLKSYQEMFSRFEPDPKVQKMKAALTELQQSLDKLDSK